MTTTFRRSPLALALLGLLYRDPMHPYAIQQRIKQWGKDKVVNVGQRASLYKTINRLREAGLIVVRETERDQQYPERTVYEITEAGRAACHAWMAEMVATPRNEFPEFPAALSFLALVTPKTAHELLTRRREALVAGLADLDAEAARTASMKLPRVVLLEDEYLRAMTDAELRWVDAVSDDLAAGRLAWDQASLAAFVDATAE
ncbi:PadR family transcriptional regulator [Embleya hyalina]|uniref:PadR family transcriptional regulator n=1 Tax=Embleya hyalina TaxID=516124 RepID=A0A401YV83_9ACTN|nr:PadR family transcriptional regulator [Embleya hyalina]GCD98500.1 PadR family transcriptional regulator [Embleya hyalina]